MCGIVGVISKKGYKNEFFISESIKALRHRGPDDYGIWHSPECYIGHTRLSILDLSKAGHQPIKSFCNNYVLSFNGEIYNHEEIRRKITNSHPNIHWKGNSN